MPFSTLPTVLGWVLSHGESEMGFHDLRLVEFCHVAHPSVAGVITLEVSVFQYWEEYITNERSSTVGLCESDGNQNSLSSGLSDVGIFVNLVSEIHLLRNGWCIPPVEGAGEESARFIGFNDI